MKKEVETTLLVVSANPGPVMDHLAALDRIGAYELLPAGSAVIHDRYYDTPERSFLDRAIALRLRRTGDSYLLCMKGHERLHECGGVERDEFEEPWSEETLETIIRVVGFCPGDSRAAAAGAGPEQALDRLGLQVIQDRQTTRIIRDIVDPQEPARRPCAEMALDTVDYLFGLRTFRHFELEIEAKGCESAAHIRDITALFEAAFPGVLQRWHHNKLITGLAIEALSSRGELPACGGCPDLLLPVHYERIDAFISRLRT